MRSITVTGVNLLSFRQFAQSGRIRPGTGVIHALAENQMPAVVDLTLALYSHSCSGERLDRLKTINRSCAFSLAYAPGTFCG